MLALEWEKGQRSRGSAWRRLEQKCLHKPKSKSRVSSSSTETRRVNFKSSFKRSLILPADILNDWSVAHFLLSTQSPRSKARRSGFDAFNGHSMPSNIYREREFRTKNDLFSFAESNKKCLNFGVKLLY